MRTVRLCDLAEINPPCGELDRLAPDGMVSFLPMEGVWPDSLQLEDRPKGEVETGYTRFQDGDLLLPKIAPTFGHGRSAVARDLLGGLGVGTTELHVLRPRADVDVRWLFYVTKSAHFLGEGEATQYGVAGQKRIDLTWLRSYRTPLIPLREQRLVADLLDQESTSVSESIRELERLASLAVERRRSLTRHVILGLDISGQKPFVGHWFDRIPSQWSGVPLKSLTSFQNGMAFRPDEWEQQGRPIIRIANLNGEETFNRTTQEIRATYIVRNGDLLFGWSGNRGTSFGPFIWRGSENEYVLNQHIFRLDAASVSKDWLYWALVAATPYVEEQAHGIIGMVHITKGRLGSVPIPLPPPQEQGAMARRLNEETSKDMKLIAEIERQITLLTEHRQALITAAITGGLDAVKKVA